MQGSETTAEAKKRKPRLSLSIDRDVGQQFSLQASQAGMSLFTFTNEWLASASKISAQGGTAAKTMDEWNICSFFRDWEVVPLPAGFVEQMVEELCNADKERALRIFSTLGENLVSLMKIYAPEVDQLADLARGFSHIAPLKRLDVERVDADSIEVSVVGAGRKSEVTECAFEFAKSVLAGYGYSIVAHELGVGTIRIDAKHRKLENRVAVGSVAH